MWTNQIFCKQKTMADHLACIYVGDGKKRSTIAQLVGQHSTTRKAPWPTTSLMMPLPPTMPLPVLGSLPWEGTFRIMKITPGSSTMISPSRLFIKDVFMEEICPHYFAQMSYERTHSTCERMGIQVPDRSSYDHEFLLRGTTPPPPQTYLCRPGHPSTGIGMLGKGGCNED